MERIVVSLLLLLSITGFSQDNKSPCKEITNKKAVKLFEKGTDKKNHSLEEKVKLLKEALLLEPDYAEAIFALADAQRRIARVNGGSSPGMVENLKKVIELCPTYNPYAYFWLGQHYFDKEDFSSAIKMMEIFLKNSDNAKSDADYNTAESILDDSKFYDKVLNHPVQFNPEPVEGVSSQFNEYLAILSHDNEMCLYTRKLPVKSKDQVFESDGMAEVFMYSKRPGTDVNFDAGYMFHQPFKAGENYGGASLSVDNKVMYVTVCKQGKMGRSNCDIYESVYSDILKEWGELKNLGPNVNTDDGWESQPSISADGKTLVFATARADSRAIDLYVSSKNSNGEWSKAHSLSPKINTDGNEKTPFLHSDSHTLYFSSDGRRGLGGYDIYFSRLNDKGEWDTPKNIGSPINTGNDEYGFFVSMDGHYGYFASNGVIAKKNKGGIDVYRFELYEEAKPDKVLLMKGDLKDSEGKPVQFGKIEVKDPHTKEVTEFAVDSLSGKYAGIVRVPRGRNLVMTVKAQDLVPVITLIAPKDSVKAGKAVKETIQVQQAQVGGTYRINNITYKTNSAQLTEESLLILDELTDYMKESETMKISIQGHTDNIGDDNTNLALSTDRAFSVYDYIMNKGIAKEHLNFKGFGETKPLGDNNFEEGRAKNRRTEFVIIER